MVVASLQQPNDKQRSRTENEQPGADSRGRRIAQADVAGVGRLAALLDASSQLHDHLCPRQVLGVRIGMLTADLLGLALPQANKRLLTFVETDGCFADGVAVSTGCTMGHRTLRLIDLGKVAATVVDTETGAAWRIVPKAQARQSAACYAPEAINRWQCMLLGYQRMPVEELLEWERVTLTLPIAEIVSHPGLRVICDACGEEILNAREVRTERGTFCRACAGDRYYSPTEEESDGNER